MPERTDNPGLLSILIPVYNRADILERTAQRLKTALAQTNVPAEIIFIDDASTDPRTRVKLRALREQDSRICVILLARTYGQVLATLIAARYAQGKYFCSLDADLECAPETVFRWIQDDASRERLFFGYRPDRRRPAVRALASRAVNLILNAKTGVRIKDWGCSFIYGPRALFSGILSRYGTNARFAKQILATHHASTLMQWQLPLTDAPAAKSSYSFFKLAQSALDVLCHYSRALAPGSPLPIVVKELLPATAQPPSAYAHS